MTTKELFKSFLVSPVFNDNFPPGILLNTSYEDKLGDLRKLVQEGKVRLTEITAQDYHVKAKNHLLVPLFKVEGEQEPCWDGYICQLGMGETALILLVPNSMVLQRKLSAG